MCKINRHNHNRAGQCGMNAGMGLNNGMLGQTGMNPAMGMGVGGNGFSFSSTSTTSTGFSGGGIPGMGCNRRHH